MTPLTKNVSFLTSYGFWETAEYFFLQTITTITTITIMTKAATPPMIPQKAVVLRPLVPVPCSEIIQIL
jgi:hypothetical protein